MSESTLAPPPLRWIWKSAALLKHKIFFWLLLQDRLNTRELLHRKNFHVYSYDCVLCSDTIIEESRNIWWRLNLEWESDLDLINMLIDAKKRYNLICFKESLIVGCWSIWNHRNRCIFCNADLDLDVCFTDFVASFHLILHKVKPSLKEGMPQWLDILKGPSRLTRGGGWIGNYKF